MQSNAKVFTYVRDLSSVWLIFLCSHDNPTNGSGLCDDKGICNWPSLKHLPPVDQLPEVGLAEDLLNVTNL